MSVATTALLPTRLVVSCKVLHVVKRKYDKSVLSSTGEMIETCGSLPVWVDEGQLPHVGSMGQEEERSQARRERSRRIREEKT